jgi:4-hydroxy-tetrahydrodipicolinate synthase
LDNEEIFGHFMMIANAVPDFPLFIYNIPELTGNNLAPGLFRKLIDTTESIAGLKTSSADMLQIQDYIRAAEDKCSIFTGCDEVILSALSLGVNGIVSGNSSAFPEVFLRLYQAFDRGDLEKAREYQFFGCQLVKVLTDGPEIAMFKKALEFRGIKVGNVRGPNREVSDDEAARLKESLKEMGLIP